MFSRIEFINIFALIVLSFLITGCGKKMVEISGKVTYDGSPIQDGTVGFSGKDNNVGLVHGAEIKDGLYQMKLPPGNYDVRFQAFEEGKASPTVPPWLAGNAVSKVQILPVQFTMGRTIKREVSATGGTFDFDLKSKDKTPE